MQKVEKLNGWSQGELKNGKKNGFGIFTFTKGNFKGDMYEG